MTDKIPENSDTTQPPDSLRRTYECECGEVFHSRTDYDDHDCEYEHEQGG